MKYYAIPLLFMIVGIFVFAMSMYFVLSDHEYSKSEKKKNYLIPNYTYFALSFAWLISGGLIAVKVWLQLNQ